MEVRNVADEVQRIHKSTVLGVAFQALEMKPCVDVDLKGSSIPPNDGTTDPTGVLVEPTGLPAGPTGLPLEPTGMTLETHEALMQHDITTV